MSSGGSTPAMSLLADELKYPKTFWEVLITDDWKRNFMEEIGMEIQEPTLVYQDNQPCIKIINGLKTSTSSAQKTMSIRTARVQELVHDEQALRVEWLETTKLISDLNTKILPRQQFEYLRNIMNGYALVMEKYPEWFAERRSESKLVWVNNYSHALDADHGEPNKDFISEFFDMC